jgi:NADH:ubiquinone oxidoreductase subunit K
MKASPLFMAVIYFIMAILFIFLAIDNVEETVWNLTTIIMASIAALDIAVALRLLASHFKMKKK